MWLVAEVEDWTGRGRGKENWEAELRGRAELRKDVAGTGEGQPSHPTQVLYRFPRVNAQAS